MDRLGKFKNEKSNLYSTGFNDKMTKNKQIFGNCSRFAKNWIAGPNNEVRQQHVPGYTGHVKHLIAENIHGDSFASCSSKAIYKKFAAGENMRPKERFLSTNTS